MDPTIRLDWERFRVRLEVVVMIGEPHWRNRPVKDGAIQSADSYSKILALHDWIQILDIWIPDFLSHIQIICYWDALLQEEWWYEYQTSI